MARQGTAIPRDLAAVGVQLRYNQNRELLPIPNPETLGIPTNQDHLPESQLHHVEGLPVLFSPNHQTVARSIRSILPMEIRILGQTQGTAQISLGNQTLVVLQILTHRGGKAASLPQVTHGRTQALLEIRTHGNLVEAMTALQAGQVAATTDLHLVGFLANLAMAAEGLLGMKSTIQLKYCSILDLCLGLMNSALLSMVSK